MELQCRMRGAATPFMCMLNQYLPIITLYNKQNFVQQVFALLAVKSGPTLTCLVISDLVSVGCWRKMALNPNYEAIGKAFTTQYYQVLQQGLPLSPYASCAMLCG